MRVIITGAKGQLGRALQKVLHEQDFEILDIPRYDVADHAIVQALPEYRPDLVIHCAAMTDVEG